MSWGRGSSRFVGTYADARRVERGLGAPFESLSGVCSPPPTVRKVPTAKGSPSYAGGPATGVVVGGGSASLAGLWGSGNPALAIRRGSRGSTPQAPSGAPRFSGMLL